MTTLYVLGDSFTTPWFCVSPQESYWGRLAKDLNVDEVINYSHSGFSFDQITHILCNETFDYVNSYFFIGVPPIERLALYQKGKQWESIRFDKDFNVLKSKIESVADTMQFDFVEGYSGARFFFDNYSFKWQQQTVCDKIYLVYKWLLGIDAKFLIVNLTNPMHYHGTNIEKKLKTIKECILFENTCHSVNEMDNIKPADWNQGTGWYGHHGPEGNFNWYNKILKPKVTELGWLVS